MEACKRADCAVYGGISRANTFMPKRSGRGKFSVEFVGSHSEMTLEGRYSGELRLANSRSGARRSAELAIGSAFYECLAEY